MQFAEKEINASGNVSIGVVVVLVVLLKRRMSEPKAE